MDIVPKEPPRLTCETTTTTTNSTATPTDPRIVPWAETLHVDQLSPGRWQLTCTNTHERKQINADVVELCWPANRADDDVSVITIKGDEFTVADIEQHLAQRLVTQPGSLETWLKTLQEGGRTKYKSLDDDKSFHRRASVSCKCWNGGELMKIPVFVFRHILSEIAPLVRDYHHSLVDGKLGAVCGYQRCCA